MSDPLFHRVAIIGLGQMGASLALAIRQGGLVGQITGYDSNEAHAQIAESLGTIDQSCRSATEAVNQADLVILCTPVGSYGSILQSVASSLTKGVIITDIGSIKNQAIRDVSPHLPAHAVFIPSHPIAGSEKVGPSHAHADFFLRHLFLITPIDGTPPAQVEPIARLWHSTGALVDLLPADLHDQIYAYMSHLPQLLAFAAAPVLQEQGAHLSESDTLFKRFIRIGRSDPHMWRDVFLENASNILSAAANLESIVTHIRDELILGAGDQQSEPTAEIRHLLLKDIWPRMLASALIMSVQLVESQMDLKLARYAAGGFTDVTSPATESPDNDFTYVSNHAYLIIGWLERYLQQQRKIMLAIEQSDMNGLMQILQECQHSSKQLLTPLH